MRQKDLYNEVTLIVKINEEGIFLNGTTVCREMNLSYNKTQDILVIIMRPVMAYAAENKRDTSETGQLLETAEVKLLRHIIEKTV